MKHYPLPKQYQYCGPALDILLDSVKDGQHAQRIRVRLGNEATRLDKYESAVYIYFISLLRKKFSLPKLDNYHDSKRHILSDHAFCRALERVYNIDMDRLKGLVMTDIAANEKFDFKGNEERIFTVMPKL